MGFDVTGGQLAVIVFIIMVGFGMMWFSYLDSMNTPDSFDSDYAACVYSCKYFSSQNFMEQCQIRCEALAVCIETDKGGN